MDDFLKQSNPVQPFIDRRRDLYEQRFKHLDEKLDSIGESLLLLARIDERHTSTMQQLLDVAKEQSSHRERLMLIERRVPNGLDKRLSAIETAMPGLREMRGWVIAGVLASAGVVGLAVFKLVVVAA